MKQDNRKRKRTVEDGKFELNYKASSTASKFHNSNAFVRGIRGPLGSGKSVACCIEMFARAKAQAKSKDGIRRTRWVVIRNTFPELESTTIKTWLYWFPEAIFGKMYNKAPYRHMVKIEDIEMEVYFIALDKPEDTKKLRSLEMTGIWINEAKFITEDIVQEATSRVGRYPSMKEKPNDVPEDKWPTYSGVIMDTNPPDDSHWWYKFAEEEPPEDWEFFAQPSGLSKDAENKENLPAKYYERMIAGKTKEWVDVNIHGKYGFIQDGRPVYGVNYKDEIHSSNKLEPIPNTKLYIGLDFGLTPCAVFGQKDAFGCWNILEELITPEGQTISLPQFAKILKSHINEKYPNYEVFFYGDPAGGFRDQQGKTAFDIYRMEGLIVRPAPTNKIESRREAVLAPLLRMANGKPAFLLSKECKILRRGFNGGYKYKRMNVSGEAKYSLEPDKNRFSHPHDALQYLLCGGGEFRDLVSKGNRNRKTVIGDDFSVWG